MTYNPFLPCSWYLSIAHTWESSRLVCCLFFCSSSTSLVLRSSVDSRDSLVLSSLGQRHKCAASQTCRRETAARRQHAVAVESRAALLRTFSMYGELLKVVRQFKYQGRVVSYDGNDTPAVRRNIKKARLTWGQFPKVLEKEEVPPRVAGMFYQAVVASVLLYGNKS